jgi:hypothetical protein
MIHDILSCYKKYFSNSNLDITLDESLLSNIYDHNESIEWFDKNDFNLQNMIIILNDNFKNIGICYAIMTKRAFLLIEDINELDNIVKYSPKTITALGEKKWFTFETFEELNKLVVPVSVFTANSKDLLVKLMIRSVQNVNIVIDTPYFFSAYSNIPNYEMSKKEKERFLKSEAHFITAHGDLLCANMTYGILCARENTNDEYGCKDYVPQCYINKKCFRKERLGNINAELINFSKLKSKMFFLNTCGGFSLCENKYKNYPVSLAMAGIENNLCIYISKYIITSSTIEELYIFWALLNIYKNFCIATFYFNKMSMQFLNKPPVTMMLGDASISFLNNQTDPFSINWTL